MFDQTWFNCLTTHFNMSMFGHRTVFDDVWLPNISHLDWSLSLRLNTVLTVLCV